jgi:hypothetical protein
MAVYRGKPLPDGVWWKLLKLSEQGLAAGRRASKLSAAAGVASSPPGSQRRSAGPGHHPAATCQSPSTPPGPTGPFRVG